MNFFTFFDFTRRERKGIIAMVLVLAILTVSVHLLPLFFKDVNMKSEQLMIAENFINNDSLRTYRQQAQYGTYRQSAYKMPEQKDNGSSTKSHYGMQIKKKMFTVNANNCDTLDLQEIRGIGSVLSKRIVAYRDKLGGFVAIEQLCEIWGIDSARYEMIKNAFIINPSNIKKININKVSINELKMHPYLDYYQAKAIVNEREKQMYKNVEEISKIEIIDDETFNRIKIYMTVE